MTGAVWISSVMSAYSVFEKQGIREKSCGEDCTEPTFILDMRAERGDESASFLKGHGDALDV